MNRRTLLLAAPSFATTTLATLATLATPTLARADPRPHLVVIGGGFGGATAARALAAAGHHVTLLDPTPEYVSCPFSNEVIAGLRPMARQSFTRAALAPLGITLLQSAATGIDPATRTITHETGTLRYDRLVLSPGVDMNWQALPGYTEAAAQRMPHAWKAGPQTTLLRDQLQSMPEGGTVVLSIPPNPYRCPPGPYERASLVAHYLKHHNPRAKLLLLDSKDQFSKQRLFQQAWQTLYPNLQWVSLSDGGRVTSVDPAAMTVSTDFDTVHANVANVIPPQHAAAIARTAGLADRTGWCPVDPTTFESRLVPGIHVIGDAAVMGAMPKSAFAANAQAKTLADAMPALLEGRPPPEPRLLNTCYSLVAPAYGISVAGVYKPANGQLTEIEGAGGTSPLGAPPSVREQEAAYAETWFDTITGAVFG